MPEPTISTTFETGYSIFRSLYRMVVSSPFTTMTALLYIQAQIVQAVQPPITYAKMDQSPVQLKHHFVDTCHQLDQLYIDYQIVTNVPSLTDVKHFIFPEIHGERQYIKSKIKLLNNYPTADDVILLEGVDKTKSVQCSSVAYDSIHHIIFHETGKVDPAYPTGKQLTEFTNMQLSDSLTCQGWDDEALTKKAGDELSELLSIIRSLEKMRDELASTHGEIQQLRSQLKNMDPRNAKLLKKIIATVRKFITSELAVSSLPLQQDYLEELNAISSTKVTKKSLAKLYAETADLVFRFVHYLQYMSSVEYQNKYLKVQDDSVVERNKVAIDVLNIYSSHAGRTFSLFGKHHVGGPTLTNKTHPAYEFRKHLENVPHAILYPKPRK